MIIKSGQCYCRWTLAVIFGFISILSTNAGPYMLPKRSIAPTNSDIDSASEGYNRVPMQISYDEYPMVVPKRAALLLDRIMVALHHALEDERDGSRRIIDVYGRHTSQAKSGQQGRHPNPKDRSSQETTGVRNFNNQLTDDYDIYSEILPIEMNDGKEKSGIDSQHQDESGFQRRAGQTADGANQSKGKVYWRCYFNAVSCF